MPRRRPARAETAIVYTSSGAEVVVSVAWPVEGIHHLSDADFAWVTKLMRLMAEAPEGSTRFAAAPLRILHPAPPKESPVDPAADALVRAVTVPVVEPPPVVEPVTRRPRKAKPNELRRREAPKPVPIRTTPARPRLEDPHRARAFDALRRMGHEGEIPPAILRSLGFLVEAGQADALAVAEAWPDHQIEAMQELFDAGSSNTPCRFWLSLFVDELFEVIRGSGLPDAAGAA